MEFMEQIKKRAKKEKKTIVLPEYMDDRVIEAAEKAAIEGIANIIILAPMKEQMSDKLVKLNQYSEIVMIDPKTSELRDKFIEKLYNLRKEKGMTLEEAERLIDEDFMYFACLLVMEGEAHGIVSGACHSSANTLRPALQLIRTRKNTKLVSAFFLMVVPDCKYGEKGVFIFADSGLVQNPNPEELAAIADSSAKSFELLVEKDAKVALLSHSTKGSASHADVDKVLEALKIAKKEYPKLQIDGELQLDAAIIPEVAKSKAPDSEIAGHANVLIFPDLDAGNIGYKLVQRLAKAEAYGPITQGIAAPVNDLSRGCSAEDILGVIAITAVQAQ